MSSGAPESEFAIGLDIGGSSMVAGVILKQTGQILSRAFRTLR